MSVALVTGATGFIGGHVAADLMTRGWTVRALVRPESMGSGRLPAGCEAVAGDLRDAAVGARRDAGRGRGVPRGRRATRSPATRRTR